MIVYDDRGPLDHGVHHGAHAGDARLDKTVHLTKIDILVIV